LFAGLEGAVLAWAVDGRAALRTPTHKESLALVWLIVAVTVVAFLCWYEGLRRLQPERATLLAGLIPVSAAVLAPMAGTGVFGVSQLLGSLLVAVGVSLGLSRSRLGGRKTTTDADGSATPVVSRGSQSQGEATADAARADP
jgi:drug/metabolite transporter (DMT)-like permease